MNGWFSRINAQTGQVASGAGEVFVDGRSLGFGHLFDWFDAQTLLVKGHGDRPTLINIHTGERQELTDYAVNQAAGGGGSWMGTGGSVIWCAVSRTGERAWIEERGGSNDDRSLFVDGLPIVQFQPINYCRIDAGYVTWSFFARGKREVWGKRPGHGPERLNVYSGDSLFAVPVLTSLGPFVVVQSHTALHVAPWGENRGTLIATGNDKNFHPDAAWTPQGLLVVWNDDRGEQGRQFIDLTRRDTLELGVVPSNPLPIPPVITPDPEPISMKLDPRVRALLIQFAAKFPVPQTPGGGEAHEERARQWSIRFCEQVDFSLPGEGYGTKRADSGRPFSKDTISQQRDGEMVTWDLLVGTGTGEPSLNLDPHGEVTTGQVFVPVAAINHLGASVPEPTPTPNPTPTPPAAGCNCAEQLEALTEHLMMLPANLASLVEQIIEEKLSELPAPEPLTSFPHYQGKFFGAPISLAPVFPEKKKEQ
jgi:hypothetical protein